MSKTTQLTTIIPKKIHKELKVVTTILNITLKELVLDALIHHLVRLSMKHEHVKRIIKTVSTEKDET